MELSALVANITSDPETLSAADVSVTSFLVEYLTDEAIANPQVMKEILYLYDGSTSTVSYEHRY